jgi:hypothetical protein
MTDIRNKLEEEKKNKKIKKQKITDKTNQ